MAKIQKAIDELKSGSVTVAKEGSELTDLNKVNGEV